MKYTHRVSENIIAAVMIGTMVLVPLSTFAKNDNDNNGKNDDKPKVQVSASSSANGKSDDKDENKDRGCWRAFGHLIAPGWIKHNGQISIGDECNLPFGIGKKFRGNNSTTTPPHGTTTPPVVDTTAPVITNLMSTSTKNQIGIRWNTDEKADAAAFVSLISPVATNGSASATNGDFTRDHRLVVRNLVASSTYYVVVRSRDKTGNVTFSNQLTVITKPPTLDVTAPVISGIVTVSSSSTVQVGWHTNELANSRVYYSKIFPLVLSASTTAFVENSTLVQNHLLNVGGLATSTLYNFAVESIDSSGNASVSTTFAASTTAGL